MKKTYLQSKELQGKILEVGDILLFPQTAIEYQIKSIPNTSFFEIACDFQGRNCTLTSRENLEELTAYVVEKFQEQEKKLQKIVTPEPNVYTHSSQLKGKNLQTGDIINFPNKSFSYEVVKDKNNPCVLLYRGSVHKFFLGSKSLEELTSKVIENFKLNEK